MRSIFTKLVLAGALALTSLGAAVTTSYAQIERERSEGRTYIPPNAPLPGPQTEFGRIDRQPPRVIDRQPPRPPERRVERYRDRDDWRRDRRDWRRDRDWDRGYYRGGRYYRDRGPAIIFETTPSYRYVEPRYVQPRYAPVRGLSRAHVQWCHNRWRSYRAYDNTYQPYNGPRRQCYSPYS